MKKYICMLLSVAILLTLPVFATDQPDPEKLYGDVNCDNEVNCADSLLILQHSIGLIDSDYGDFSCARVADKSNDDPTSTDAMLVLQYSVSKIKYFPVECTKVKFETWTNDNEKEYFRYKGEISGCKSPENFYVFKNSGECPDQMYTIPWINDALFEENCVLSFDDRSGTNAYHLTVTDMYFVKGELHVSLLRTEHYSVTCEIVQRKYFVKINQKLPDIKRYSFDYKVEMVRE